MTWENVGTAVDELAAQIRTAEFMPDAVLALARGGLPAAGALAYAEAHGAAAVRVDFRSPLYLDPCRGPNWWTYFFEASEMRVPGAAPAAGEVHLDRRIAKYGKHGGFCDYVNGVTPYLYPMTCGNSRRVMPQVIG